MTIKEKNKDSYKALKESLHLKNSMQAPKLVKVVLSVGTGKVADKKRKEFIAERLSRIAGQKVATRAAKKSIASFKVRQGDNVGFQATLRGDRMMNFLEKLIHIALPRTKDFRGLKADAIDAMGNITIGIKEHTIFPETADEDIKDVFSFAFTVVTTSKKKADTKAFLEYLGFPFSK
ncbi:MAG: 50S ribosomal protein L5 [Candidatus Paceibacterota bacterium]|jgi:large subunit ribosomal protein L5